MSNGCELAEGHHRNIAELLIDEDGGEQRGDGVYTLYEFADWDNVAGAPPGNAGYKSSVDEGRAVKTAALNGNWTRPEQHGVGDLGTVYEPRPGERPGTGFNPATRDFRLPSG